MLADLSTILSPKDRSSGSKINRGTSKLNDFLHQMALAVIYRIFYLNAKECTISAAHRRFSKRDHVLEHKSNFIKPTKKERKRGHIKSVLFEKHLST